MHWAAIPILLQSQQTRSLREVRVVLDERGSRDSVHQVPCKEPVGSEFIVPVVRNPHITLPDKLNNLL
jgi:hypothetical protein